MEPSEKKTKKVSAGRNVGRSSARWNKGVPPERFGQQTQTGPTGRKGQASELLGTTKSPSKFSTSVNSSETDDKDEMKKGSCGRYLSDELLKNRIEDVRALCSLALESGVERNELAKRVEELLELLRSGSGEGPRRKRPRRDESGIVIEEVQISEEERLKTIVLRIGAALSNELILKNIFKYLSFQDLKDCKQVNRVWKRVSNETLSGRNTFITSRLSWWGTSRSVGNHLWKELATCIEASVKDSQPWPAPGVILGLEAWATNPRATALLQSFGGNIKRLMITDLRPPKFSLVRRLFVKGFPNLVSLQLMELGNIEDGLSAPSLTEGLVLPALKTLRIPNMPEKTSRMYIVHGRIVRQILSSAVNLKLVENFSPCFTEDLARLKKLGTVQSLALKLTEAESEGAFLDVVFPCLKRVRITIGTTGMPLRRELSFDYLYGLDNLYGFDESESESENEEEEAERERINDTLDRYRDVFSRWGNTVEEMEIPPLERLHENLPRRMPNLRLLTLFGHFNILRFPVFFRYEDSEQAFPALEEVRLKMNFGAPPTDFNVVRLEDFLLLPQVKALRIKGFYWNFHEFERLNNLFPCLTSLHLRWPRKFHGKNIAVGDYYSLIWRLDFLTRLEITDFSLAKFIPVDSLITGLTDETCRQLRREQKLEQDLIFFRRRDSISRLGELRRFKLVLSDLPLSQEKEIGTLSHVSHFYGFGCVPNLEVVICYNFRHAGAQRIAKAIEGVRPFVTVVHEELK